MTFSKNIYAVLASVLLTTFSVNAADTTPKSDLPSEVVRPLSIFDSKSSSVRDPFFPKSGRSPYVQQTPIPAVKGQQPTAAPEAKLYLKGILGSLALINNGTFSEGESRSVKVPGGQVRIRCVKINERSVLVNIEDRNEQVELRLQDK